MEAKPYLKEIKLQAELISDHNVYPFNIPAIAKLSSLKFHADVTFIIGENGSGKSTLIEAIALSLGFGIEGGTKNIQHKTHDNASHLCNYIKTVKSYKKPSDYYFLRAESFYNVATYMDELDREVVNENEKYLKSYGGSLHERSHGEAFMAALTKKLKGRGLYIFDEPEAALSPSRQLNTLRTINRLVGENSQFIIATHSPILLAYPYATIYKLDNSGINQVEYEETEHYQITRHFLNDYKKLVGMLLDE